MLGLFLMGVAVAQTVPEPDVTVPEIMRVPAIEAQRSSQRGTGAKGGQKSDWKTQFYARPAMGGSSYTTASGETLTALSVGGEGGLRYSERGKDAPRLRGRTRVMLQYVLSAGDAEGMEVKVGSFLGPWWKFFGLTSGLDVFWNRYIWGGVPLEPTVGVGVPLIATTGVSAFSVYGGIEPAWIANEERRVDWSQNDEFGFGHQFTTMTGVNVRLDDISVGVGYSRSVTVGGVQQGYGISLMLRG